MRRFSTIFGVSGAACTLEARDRAGSPVTVDARQRPRGHGCCCRCLKVKERARIGAIYVLLLGAVVFAAGVPILHRLYWRGCRLPVRLCCIANLKQIEGAKHTWMLEKEKTTNDIPTDAELFGA